MTDIKTDIAARARALRAEASAHLQRAEDLRQAAEEAECAAWRAQAEAAVVEASASRRNAPPRHRQAIHGNPTSSGNRLLALMTALCIDEHVNFREGLGEQLRIVEARLGICYARRGTPTVGMRLDICERAMAAPAEMPAMAA